MSELPVPELKVALLLGLSVIVLIVLRKGLGVDAFAIPMGLVSEFKDLLSAKVTPGSINAALLVAILLLIIVFFAPVALIQVYNAVSSVDTSYMMIGVGIFSIFMLSVTMLVSLWLVQRI